MTECDDQHRRSGRASNPQIADSLPTKIIGGPHQVEDRACCCLQNGDHQQAECYRSNQTVGNDPTGLLAIAPSERLGYQRSDAVRQEVKSKKRQPEDGCIDSKSG